MPITVITGQPGNGKTLRSMEMLEAALKKGDRPVYVSGVKGSLPAKARQLENAREWEKVEDGALIFIDEAWRDFGHLQDARGAPTPAYVQALATHRHRGIDFVMTTQMVNQLYPFMRGLIGEHVHVVRKFGTSLCTVYTWGEVCEDVKSQGQRDKALSSSWVQPSHLFGQFESATMHTIKRKIPWRLALIPACIIGALVLGWVVYAKMKTGELNATAQQADSGVAGTASTARPVAGTGKASMTPAEWKKMVTPRIAGIHGSQPLFDGRKALSRPATYCMISGPVETGRCVCYTEQATVIPDVLPSRCRRAARFGEYDPFKAPMTAGKPVSAPAPGQDEDTDLGGAVAPGDPAVVGSPAMGLVQGKSL